MLSVECWLCIGYVMVMCWLCVGYDVTTTYLLCCFDLLFFFGAHVTQLFWVVFVAFVAFVLCVARKSMPSFA